MLQIIRDGARGWLAAAIITLLIISFGVFGGAASFGGGSEPNVAKVDGQEITLREYQQRYQNAYRQQQQRLGENFSPELINEPALKRGVLEALVSSANLQAWVDASGYGVSDELVVSQIRDGMFFKEDGVFSVDRYKQFLSRIGQTQLQYEASVRENIMLGQVRQGLRTTGTTASPELARIFKIQNQTRDVQTATLVVADIAKGVEVSGQEVADYFNEHAANFVSEDRVKVQYLEIVPEAVAGSVELDPAVVRIEYDENLARYGVEETRRASHILLTSAEMSDAEAIAKLEEVRAKVVSGESFADFAKALSADSGSGKLGGDLNWAARGRMVPEFDEAMFSLPEAGALSGVVKTQYGHHLIQLTDIRPASTKSFEDVRGQIEAELAEREAETLLIELSKQLQELTYDNPSTLDVAAQALELEVQTSSWFTRATGAGVAQFPAVRAASFDGIVLDDNDNSDLIELESGGLVVVRKLAHEPSKQLEMADVSDDITALIQTNEARRVAIAQSSEIAGRIRTGQSVAEAGEQSNALLSSVYVVTRGGSSLPQEVVRAAFELERPVDGTPSLTTVQRGNGDQVVVAVSAVVDAQAATGEDVQAAALKASVTSSRGQAETAALMRSLRASADVVIWEERL